MEGDDVQRGALVDGEGEDVAVWAHLLGLGLALLVRCIPVYNSGQGVVHAYTNSQPTPPPPPQLPSS